jgi:outer membrane protein
MVTRYRSILAGAIYLRCTALLLSSFTSIVLSSGADAETMSDALSRAYLTSPELNAQRADTRAVDENVPTALAGFRPTVGLQADGGLLNTLSNAPSYQYNQTCPPAYSGCISPASVYRSLTHPSGAQLTLNQTIFDGFKTLNAVRAAESQVHSSRQTLRYSELSVLASAASAYMDVLRDTAVLSLRKNYVRVLEAQVEDTQTRLRLGEVTRTDLDQARGALEQGRADRATAETTLATSLAKFRQLIGVAPKDLQPARSVGALLPSSLDEAYRIAEAEHPLILAARANVDAAGYNIEINFSQLMPQLGLSGHLTRRFTDYGSVEGQRYYEGYVAATLNVPIYDGGVAYSSVRQAKEKYTEAKILLDQQAFQVRATVQGDWAGWQNSHAVVQAARREVTAAEAALSGIREEARLGERTTFDILTAQINLLNARLLVVSAQHDEVLASYAVLASVGRLSADTLGLNVPKYSPGEHYDRVKYKLFGVNP